MVTLKSSFFKKLLLGSIILILLQVNSYSFWTENGSQIIFYTGTVSPITKKDINGVSGINLETYIIKSASSFLESYSYTLQYMKKTESMPLDGVNPVELKTLLVNALESMKHANECYVNLKNAADKMSYNPGVIEELKNFSYEGYLKSNSQYLNKELFREVKSYLFYGDIRGVYRKSVSDTAKIMVILNRLITATDEGIIPSLEDTWKVNQLYSQSLLFGQYVAQIFDKISSEEK